jgi:hypothetical protein
MFEERRVTRPLVARKRDGSRLDLILIDAGRTVDVRGTQDSNNLLLLYKGNYLVADSREVDARTEPLTAAASG